MAEEKRTDSAAQQGPAGSESASPGTPEKFDGELAELDALDRREDEFGSDVADEDIDEDTDDENGSNGHRELVGVGATSKARRSGGTAGSLATTTTAGRGKKNRATPKQRTGETGPRRTGPIGFVKGSVSELKKVVYPTGSQLGNYFLVVLVFVLMVIAIVTGLDYLFGWLVLRVFT